MRRRAGRVTHVVQAVEESHQVIASARKLFGHRHLEAGIGEYVVP